MARPHKDERLLMNVPVKIMVTAEQRALFDGAAAASMMDLSAWARGVLLEAAKQVATAQESDVNKRRPRAQRKRET